MSSPQICVCILSFLFLSQITLIAQEDVILHDSLKAHAEILEVGIKNVNGRSREFTLGKYMVFADEEWSATERKTKERLNGARIVTDIVNTYAFTITAGGADTLEVFVEEKLRENIYHPNEILDNFILSESSSTKTVSFAAWINLKGDTSITWTLYKPKTQKKDKLGVEMLLSDGKKFMQVSPVSSDPYFNYNHPMWDVLKGAALGVEFIDDGNFICAVQLTPQTKGYFHLADNYTYPGKVWMHHELHEDTRLVVAAAMSTLLLLHNPYLAIQLD